MALSPRGKNQGDRCPVCTKRVYDIEKLTVDGVIFHRGCLKCASCATTLKAGAIATDNGKYYCKNHAPARPTVQRVLSSGGTKPAAPPVQINSKSEEKKAEAVPESGSREGSDVRDRRDKREREKDTHRDKERDRAKRETSKRDLEDGHGTKRTARGGDSTASDSVRTHAMVEQLVVEVKRLEGEASSLKSSLKKSEAKRKSMKKEIKRLDGALQETQKQSTATSTALTERALFAEKRMEDLQGQLTRILDLLGKLQSAVGTAAKTPTASPTTPKTDKSGDKIIEKEPSGGPNGADKKAKSKGVRFAEDDGSAPAAAASTSSNGRSEPDADGEGENDTSGIKALFKFKRKIGKGATAVVYEARNKKTNQRVAVKKIKKSLIKDEQSLWNELDIVRALNHPNIVAYLEHHEDTEHYYIVMELVDGKELFEKILEKGFYSERDAQRLVIQLLDAIIYLHDKGIAHRDLKPENLLTSGEGEKEIVKVTDFGLSKCFKEAPLKTMCGSSVYIAPEVVEGGHYDTAVDLWSLGVIVYILLCGYPPWKNPPERATQLIMEILACNITFHEEDWRDISPEAKDFIQHLIVKDPKARMSAKEARSHPWIKKRLEDDRRARQNLDRTMSRLEIFLRGEGAPADWEINYKEMSPLLTQPIAEGAFAFVYKVNWKGRPVAVKKIKFEKDETDEEEMTEDFKKEVEIMSKLKHDNIVQFVGATIHFPNLCIVTEWYDRGSLNDLLHRKSVEFDWPLKVKLCLQVAQGLNYLHTRNPKIIHRDIKAENVFIDAAWTAKLGDFGLSKIKLDSKAIMRRIESQRAVGKMYKTPLESRIEISKSGTVGTPAWIAPEILDMKPYSERADVYSYGVFLWEVLTRKLPHSDKGDYSIAMGVLTQDERPEIPSDTPAKFAQLMRDCWAPRSEDRLSTEAIIATFHKYGADRRNWE